MAKITRKITREPKPDKPWIQRTKRVKIDLSKLPEAVIDGQLTVPVNGRVFFERTLSGRTAVHEGYIFSVEGTIVTVWDETRGQFWAFDLAQQVPVIKAASR